MLFSKMIENSVVEHVSLIITVLSSSIFTSLAGRTQKGEAILGEHFSMGTTD